jgi:hypothetical protein
VLIGNRPSFESKFYGNIFKYIMMNLCSNYMGNGLLKMFPMMTKSKLNKLREKFGKTFTNRGKQTIDDVVK